MYETLAMLKPGASYSADELYRLVYDLARYELYVERDGDLIRLVVGDAWLGISWSDAPHIIEESDEIAGQFGIPCRGCHIRIEMSGDDPGMDLFNHYLIINEKLQATGKFVIFDSQQCKLMFEDGE